MDVNFASAAGLYMCAADVRKLFFPILWKNLFFCALTRSLCLKHSLPLIYYVLYNVHPVPRCCCRRRRTNAKE